MRTENNEMTPEELRKNLLAFLVYIAYGVGGLLLLLGLLGFISGATEHAPTPLAVLEQIRQMIGSAFAVVLGWALIKVLRKNTSFKESRPLKKE